MRRIVWGAASAAWLFGCGGGAASSSGPATPSGEHDEEKDPRLQITGGLDSIAVPAGVRLGPPLAMRVIEAQHPVKLDGLVREWQLLSPAKEHEGNPSTNLQTALQYDDHKIYVAVEVDDANFERTGKFSDKEDHVALVLAFPTASGFSAFEIGLFAGKPGESAGAVRWLSGSKKGKDVAGAKVVEAPKDGGYTFEAVVPWSVFGDAAKVRLGLRGAVRLVDASGVVATGKGSASDVSALPQLFTEPEVALFEGLLQPKGLAEQAPLFDLLADVAEDGDRERIAVYGNFVTVVGHHYRGGKQFFFRDVGTQFKLTSLKAAPGEAKGDKERLAVEYVSSKGDKRIESWGFAGGEPDIVDQSPQPAAVASAPTPPKGAITTAATSEPKSPPVKTNSQLSEDLLAGFKKEHGIAAGASAKVNLETNLAEDTRAERAVLFGRDLAVFGPGFRGGKGYVYARLEAFSKDEDVSEVTAKDLTGDGRSELIVRGTRRQGSGSDAVANDLIIVYQATPEGMRRVFAVEAAREQNGKRVQGMVQFVPSAKGGFEIDVRPGSAKGFSAKDYPWREEEPGGQVEPLLLPWGKQKALRYRFDGSKFAPV